MNAGTVRNTKTLASTIVGLDSDSIRIQTLLMSQRGIIATSKVWIKLAVRGLLDLLLPPSLYPRQCKRAPPFTKTLKFKSDKSAAMCVAHWAPSTRWLVNSQTASTNLNTSADQQKTAFCTSFIVRSAEGEKKWLLKTLAALLGFFNVTCCDAKLAECEIASREKNTISPKPS